jgi:hypothetical protein
MASSNLRHILLILERRDLHDVAELIHKVGLPALQIAGDSLVGKELVKLVD